MIANDLSDRIWSHESFQNDYRSLMVEHLRYTFGFTKTAGLTKRQITKLAQTAATFAVTAHPQYRESSYRIAIALLEVCKSDFDAMPDLAHLILSRLGNFPARCLVTSTFKYTNAIPIQLRGESWQHEEANTVVFFKNHLLLTDFQRKLWNFLSAGYSMSLTAPTSAGKSWVLQRYILNLLTDSQRANSGIAVYVVPTRALINQVGSTFSSVLKEWKIEDISVCPIPITPAEVAKDKIIYVLTQERLQVLLENVQISPDILIVDESQTISEDSRGVILHSVVERMLHSTQQLQVLFASPFIKNPEIFFETFELDKPLPFKYSETPVSQNIIYVSTPKGVYDECTLQAKINNQLMNLGNKTLPRNSYNSSSLLINVAWEFGKNDKNLVYAGGAADCESIASMICDTISEFEPDTIAAPEILDFVDFVREHIHPDYILANALEKQVAFHYGNMPAIIRRTIEDLFSEGKLRYLICTSTLLHGVNLPAKNMFLLNPTRGNNIPISSSDFWNLAGRVGRMGKDFHGNVFAINPTEWAENPIEGDKHQSVIPSYFYYINQHTRELSEYIHDQDFPSGKQLGLESSFSKLLYEFRTSTIVDTFSKAKLSASQASILMNALSTASQLITLPNEILQRNLTISPYRQQELYNYLISKIIAGHAKDIIPLHPLVGGKVAFENILRLLKRIHKCLQKLPSKDNSHRYFAMLAQHWMCGDSLARMINNAYEYKIKKRKAKGMPAVASVIRDVMRQIENDLRFRYVKYTTCYNDLLQYALIQTGNDALVKGIPQIPLYLELGASSKSMVSFISLGLSRTTAGILSEKTVNKDMDRTHTLIWIKNQNLASLGVPQVCIREILKVLGL